MPMNCQLSSIHSALTCRALDPIAKADMLSQFDYWFDTSKFMVEHYADGDLVNCDTPVAKVQAGPQALSVWGPPVPSVF